MFEYEDIKPRPAQPGSVNERWARALAIHLDSDQVFCLIPAFLSDS